MEPILTMAQEAQIAGLLVFGLVGLCVLTTLCLLAIDWVKCRLQK